MKRFALVALLAAMLFGVASSASATELKVKGNLDVHGMWSANLRDFDSDNGDGDNYYTSQRMRTYFTFQAHENLKAVLGLEINNVWGDAAGDWGTDGVDTMRVKHAYMDFNFPDTAINVKAGLQGVALPSVFGNPVFDDDAAALVISAPINDMFGLTVGYSRGADNTNNYSTTSVSKDDVDMFFLAAPITLDGFSVAPYFAYAAVGKNATYELTTQGVDADDDTDIWVLGANAALTMFDPFTLEMDLIYGEGENDNLETKGWYGALAASYKMDMVTPILFTTYATGFSDDADDHDVLPTLAEGWALTPYLGGARAFATGASDGFATDTAKIGNDGTGLWTIGLILADISFVDKLSHNLTIAYAEGTSDKDADVAFDEKDSAWEVYFVNKYMIYENLAAINELGYFAPDFDDAGVEDDASYFATVGFSYKF
ncbi:MAG: outer membrane homotrimeric porin [Desulfomicrobium sp.]